MAGTMAFDPIALGDELVETFDPIALGDELVTDFNPIELGDEPLGQPSPAAERAGAAMTYALAKAQHETTDDDGARQTANYERAQLRKAGWTDAQIAAVEEDAGKLVFKSPYFQPKAVAQLSDGTIVVDPELALDPMAWNAAVDTMKHATQEQRDRAKDERWAAREDLARELEPIAQQSKKYLEYLNDREKETGLDRKGLYAQLGEGELLEEFRKRTGTGFGNLAQQLGGGVTGALARTGQGIFGAADLASPTPGEGTLAELSDEARIQAEKSERVRNALSGGWWARKSGDFASTVTGTLPAFIAGPAGLTGMALTGGAIQAGQTFNDAQASGLTVQEAEALALESGAKEAAITMAFGKTGIEGAALNAGRRGVASRIIRGGLEEVPEEIFQRIAQEPVQSAIDPGKDPLTVGELGEIGLQSFVLGGGLNALNRAPREAGDVKPQAGVDVAEESKQIAEILADEVRQETEGRWMPPEDELLPEEEQALYREPAPQTPPDDAWANRNAFPRGLAEFVTPEEAAALESAPGGIGNKRHIAMMSNLMAKANGRQQAAVEEGDSAERAAIDAGEMAELVEAPADAEGVPFSQQRVASPPPEIEAEARRTMGILGIKPEGVTVQVVSDPAQIEDAGLRSQVQRSMQRGNRVEGFYQRETGGRPARVVLIADGKLTADRARELIQHEIVGHRGMRALFEGKQKARYEDFTERLWDQRLKGVKTFTETRLGYRSMQELQDLYHDPAHGQNYDAATKEGRRNLVEEHLARLAEVKASYPWYKEALAWLKYQLREMSGGRWFTSVSENDVEALLAQARRAARPAGSPDVRTDAVRFSQRPPEQGEVEAAGKTELKRRGFVQSVKDSPAIHQTVRDLTESLYRPITNQATVTSAQAFLQKHGEDISIQRILKLDARRNAPTAEDMTLGIELINRLQTQGRDDDAAEIAIKISESATGPAQALQALSMMSRLSPAGIQAMAHKIVKQHALEGEKSPEVKRLYEELEGLRKRLAEIQKANATSAIGSIEDLLRTTGLTPERMSELQVRLREILMQSVNDPGIARTRLIAMIVARGVKQKTAERMADKAIAEWQKAAQKARDKMLRQLMRVREGMPATPRLDEEMQARLRQLFENRGNLWGRYRDQAAQSIVDRLTRQPGQGQPRRAALAEFSTRMLGELQARIPEAALPPAGTPNITPAARVLGEALNNREKHAEVWQQARAAALQGVPPEQAAVLEQLLEQELSRPYSADTVSRAIAEATEELDTSIRDILLRAPEGEQRAVRARIAETIVQQAEVDPESGRALAGDILQAYDRAMADAREAYAQSLFKHRVTRVPRGDFAKWIEMNNAGLLDDEQFYGGLMRKMDFPVFLRSDAARIQALQREYAAAPPGDLQLAAAARMMSAVYELVPEDAWGKVNALRNLAMLLNPKTIIRNVGGNIGQFAVDLPADALAWGIDKAVGLVTGRRTRASIDVGVRLHGLMQPVRDFVTGYRQLRASESSAREAVWGGLRHLRTMAQVTQSGITDPRQLTERFRHVFSSRFMRLWEDGLATSLGAGDRAFWTAAFQSSLARQLNAERAMGRAHNAASPEMMETAMLDAQRAIFQDENVVSERLGALKRAGNGKKAFGVGSLVLPFTQVPGSIFNRMLEFSPFGFITGVLNAPKGKRLTQRTLVDAFSRATVGSGMLGLGLWLAKLGVITALKDEDRDREEMRRKMGLGGYRINLSELKRRMLTGNWNPEDEVLDQSQDGDVVTNYDWMQPSAFSLAAGAQLADELVSADGKTSTGLTKAWLAASAGLRTLEEQPLLQAITGFMGNASRDGIGTALFNQVLKAPSSFIPSFVNQITQAMDNVVRETRDADPIQQLINEMAAKLPGLSKTLPARSDVAGEEMERYQGGGNTLANVFLNPAWVTEVKKHPELMEFDRLYRATGEKKATPGVPRETKLKINGKDLALTNENLATYQDFVMRNGLVLAKRMMEVPGWADAPEGKTTDIVADIYSGAAQAGRYVLFGDRPKVENINKYGRHIIGQWMELHPEWTR